MTNTTASLSYLKINVREKLLFSELLSVLPHERVSQAGNNGCKVVNLTFGHRRFEMREHC